MEVVGRASGGERRTWAGTVPHDEQTVDTREERELKSEQRRGRHGCESIRAHISYQGYTLACRHGSIGVEEQCMRSPRRLAIRSQ